MLCVVVSPALCSMRGQLECNTRHFSITRYLFLSLVGKKKEKKLFGRHTGNVLLLVSATKNNREQLNTERGEVKIVTQETD